MLTVEALRHYNTGFELGDIFGSGRMKDLIWSFKEQLAEDQGEIAQWQEVAKSQADLIERLYSRLEEQASEPELRKENEELRRQVSNMEEMIRSLLEYNESLEGKLRESAFADKEACRILKAIQSKKWNDEEVS